MHTDKTNKNNTLLWISLIIACILPTLATWLYFVVLSGSPIMGIVYGASKVIQFSLPVLVVALLLRQPIRFFPGKSRGLGPGIAFGAVVSIAIIALYLGYLKTSPVFAGFDAALREKLAGMGATTPARYALLACFIAIFHSFLEEYYWRWFVYGQLRRLTRPAVAMVVSAIGFAAHHVIVVAAYTGWHQWKWILFFSLGVAVGGAVWNFLYARHNSLMAPWISHLLVDVALLIVGALHLWG